MTRKIDKKSAVCTMGDGRENERTKTNGREKEGLESRTNGVSPVRQYLLSSTMNNEGIEAKVGSCDGEFLATRSRLNRPRPPSNCSVLSFILLLFY